MEHKSPLVQAQELQVLHFLTLLGIESHGDLSEEMEDIHKEGLLSDSDHATLRRLGGALYMLGMRLGGALYMLGMDEMFYVDSAEPLEATYVRSLILDSQWNKLLDELRTDYKNLVPWVRSYLRGIAYSHLGLHCAAWAFYRYAADQSAKEEQSAKEAVDETMSHVYKLRLWAAESLKLWNPERAAKEAIEILKSTDRIHPKIVIYSASLYLSNGDFQELDRQSAFDKMMQAREESENWPTCSETNLLCGIFIEHLGGDRDYSDLTLPVEFKNVVSK